jgi:hypothetical protein
MQFESLAAQLGLCPLNPCGTAKVPHASIKLLGTQVHAILEKFADMSSWARDISVDIAVFINGLGGVHFPN